MREKNKRVIPLFNHGGHFVYFKNRLKLIKRKT